MRLLFLLVIFISACKERTVGKTIPDLQTQDKRDTTKKISIEKVGELRFRVSYNVGDKILSLEELKKRGEDKPAYYYAGEPDSFLLKRMEALNYLDQNYNLFRGKFKINKSKEFEVIGNDSIALKCWFIRPQDTTKYDKYNLVLSKNNLNTEIEIEGFYGFTYDEIKYN